MGSRSRCTPWRLTSGPPLPLAAAAGHFVDFVDEDDAGVFGLANGFVLHLVHVDELGGFLVEQQLAGFGHGHLALAGFLGHHVAQHVLQARERALVHAGRRAHHAHAGAGLRHLNFDFAVFQLAVLDFLAEPLAGALVQLGVGLRHVVGPAPLPKPTPGFGAGGLRHGRNQGIENQLFHGVGGLGFHGFLAAGLHAVHALLGQVAHHAFHVAAHVAHFGELAGFHFHKGRIGEVGQAAGNFGFAHAGGPNHEDVVGHDFGLHVGRGVQAAPAVAQGNGHVALGLVLADDVLVKLGHNLGRGQEDLG